MATTTERPTALDPLDYLGIDALLDDEERAVRDAVRQFVRDNVLDEVGDWFEKGIFPREIFQELAKLGLLGMHLDGYGLPGTSSRSSRCSGVSAKDTPESMPVSSKVVTPQFPLD